MKSSLIQIRSLFFICLLLFFNTAQSDVNVDTVEDLGELKLQAEKKNLPVLLLFTAEHCEYCEIIKDEFLLPMIRSGDYDSTILIRQVNIESYHHLRNEKGEEITGDVLAKKYNIIVTPTIVFISSEGKELTKRLVGVGNVYYFGGTLDEHIDQAVKSQSLNRRALSFQAIIPQAINSSVQNLQTKEFSNKVN